MACCLRINHIMLRDELTQMTSQKNPVTVFVPPEHVESENINLKIGYGSSLYQLFSKRYFYFINCG
jgi:hypothetical protein